MIELLVASLHRRRASRPASGARPGFHKALRDERRDPEKPGAVADHQVTRAGKRRSAAEIAETPGEAVRDRVRAAR